MNQINKEIEPSDREVGKGKSPATLAEEILRVLESSEPFSTVFVEGIPQEQRARVQATLKRNFELWANSWIAPNLRAIITKYTP